MLRKYFIPVVFYLFATPAFGGQAALPDSEQLNMSEKKEAEIGREIYEKITTEMAIYQDSRLTDYVEMVGSRIVKSSDKPDGEFKFTVIDDPGINAFATPGGYIYVNRGLITYLNSEAQLAAVLAHEVAHVTARHASRQKRAQTTSNIAATLLAVLSRSAEVGEATALWGAATVSGYGREMELEADGLGAKFLTNAGYNTEAMIEVVTLLKDNERFERKKAQDTGKKPQTYHGLFATHPRNDKRLREVINSAGNVGRAGEENIIPFRLATDQLVWGENFEAKKRKENRFYQERLRFRFDYPEGWQFSDQGKQIAGKPADGQGELMLEIRPRTLDEPNEFIKKQLGIGFIKKSEPFLQNGLRAHTGLVPGKDGTPDQRLAVVYLNRYALVFTGTVLDKKQEKSLNEDFLSIIHSLAPLSRAELDSREPQRISYVKATEGTTFARLADYLKLGKFGEEQLRLINDFYPTGEPEDGQWIKIIR